MAMRKFMVFLLVLACLMTMPVGAQAYTINDNVPDSIGYPVYESYGITVYNFTPGTNSGNIVIDLFTNFPPTGNTVGSWITKPADLFITETYQGSQYEWAIPTATHDSFQAGYLYAVGTYKVSDDFDPSPGSYSYNHNFPVWIDSVGSNYGWTSIAGSVAYSGPSASMPYYTYRITTGFYEDDPSAVLAFRWGTATCANDIITGQIPTPIPPAFLLLGSGLVGLLTVRRRKLQK